MRIRKAAKLLLGFSSCQPWLSPPASLAGPPALPLPGREVCQLNQSPWDVDGDDFLLLDYDPKQQEEEEECIAIEENEGEEEEKQEAREAEEVERPFPIVKKKKRTERKQVATRESTPIPMPALVPAKQGRKRCSKTDGKEWRCKRPAQHPHSFCKYHLTQLRSYNAASRSSAAAATVVGARHRKATAGAVVGYDFYYYSEFGPWRGKWRCKKKEIHQEEEVDEVKVEEKEKEEENREDGKNDRNHDKRNEEKKLEDLKEKKRDGLRKKRGRKRMKARSLKSLL